MADFLARRKLENLRELERSAAAAKPAEEKKEKAGAAAYRDSKEKSREDRKKKNRISYLETEIAKLEDRMKDIEAVLSDPGDRKQDEILDKMNSMERELLRQVGNINVSMGSLSSDVQGLSRLLTFCDTGYRINRDPSDIK